MANSTTHAALPYPIKKARFTLAVPYLDADGDPTDPTTPDTEISKDAGAFADCAEEVTTISGSNGAGYLTLTGAEMDCAMAVLAAKVASGPKATLMTLYPRELPIVASGTLSAGSTNGGTLGTVLAYDITGCFIRTTGGTGGGGTGSANNQARRIVTYDTSSGAFTTAQVFEVQPDNTTTYDILLPEGMTIGMLKALNPTTAGRKLDVSTGGEAGLDWANIGSPTTTVGLSGTTVKTATDVETDTADIQTRLPAALVSGRIDASVGAMASSVITASAIASAAITSAKFATDAIDANALKADAVTEIQSGLATAASQTTIIGYIDTEVAAALAILNKLDSALELDGAVYRFTTNALELAPGGGGVLAAGTAQAGGADTITIAAGDTAGTNSYRLSTIAITGGTGKGQSRHCSGYDSSSKVLTVDNPWDIVPDNTSTYIIMPFGADAASVDTLVTEFYAAQRVDHKIAGSFGERHPADLEQILGDSDAVQALKEILDGTGRVVFADVKQVNGSTVAGDGSLANPWRKA